MSLCCLAPICVTYTPSGTLPLLTIQFKVPSSLCANYSPIIVQTPNYLLHHTVGAGDFITIYKPVDVVCTKCISLLLDINTIALQQTDHLAVLFKLEWEFSLRNRVYHTVHGLKSWWHPHIIFLSKMSYKWKHFILCMVASSLVVLQQTLVAGWKCMNSSSCF